jgi:hypothetical protein
MDEVHRLICLSALSETLSATEKIIVVGSI